MLILMNNIVFMIQEQEMDITEISGNQQKNVETNICIKKKNKKVLINTDLNIVHHIKTVVDPPSPNIVRRNLSSYKNNINTNNKNDINTYNNHNNKINNSIQLKPAIKKINKYNTQIQFQNQNTEFIVNYKRANINIIKPAPLVKLRCMNFTRNVPT
jgi:hypothetical protein